MLLQLDITSQEYQAMSRREKARADREAHIKTEQLRLWARMLMQRLELIAMEPPEAVLTQKEMDFIKAYNTGMFG